MEEISDIERLVVKIMEDGRLVYDLPDIEMIRETKRKDLERLYPGVKRLMNPHGYHVSLTDRLWNLKKELITQYKNGNGNHGKEN